MEEGLEVCRGGEREEIIRGKIDRPNRAGLEYSQLGFLPATLEELSELRVEERLVCFVRVHDDEKGVVVM